LKEGQPVGTLESCFSEKLLVIESEIETASDGVTVMVALVNKVLFGKHGDND